MGKMNIANLYARVATTPTIEKYTETGEYRCGMVYLDVVRGFRQIDDDVRFVKHDKPLVISMENEIVSKMEEWSENDIVYLKGVVTSKSVDKTSYCPFCTDERGNATENKSTGNLLYITPIFVEKIRSYDDKISATEDIIAHREISNQVYVVGTLVKDPKLYTTKSGVRITQYPIAINRKYTIRTDDPLVKTDWPIVKSYGENALEDKLYLQFQAEVLIDGFLQARTVKRKTKCKCCEKIYEWDDRAMEIVPYATEYLTGAKSREQVEGETQKTVEDLKQMLFASGYKDDLDDDLKSSDVRDTEENNPE